MKRVLILTLVTLFALSMSAFAAYHVGSESKCYQCHTMHYSQTHNYPNSNAPVFAGGPFNNLLKGPVNDICLACHDANDSKDVYGATLPTAIRDRQAGFLNKVGDGSETKGHTLNITAVAPGSNPNWSNANGLNCVDCHAPHGEIDANHPDPVRGQWCNLKEQPGTAASPLYLTYQDSSVAVPALGRDVFHRGSWETDSVDFFEPSQTASRYGAWCKGCHTNFHGSSSDPNMRNVNGWIRHPTADADLGVGQSSLTKFAGHLYRPQVMSSTGNWGTQGQAFSSPPSDLTPSCFTCHKAHGNNNVFGLVYLTGNLPRSENGDGDRMHTTCSLCHVQGG